MDKRTLSRVAAFSLYINMKAPSQAITWKRFSLILILVLLVLSAYWRIFRYVPRVKDGEYQGWLIYTVPGTYGYRVYYPPKWDMKTVKGVNEQETNARGIGNGEYVTIFAPTNGEPFMNYLRIALQKRSVYEFKTLYASESPSSSGAEDVIFNGWSAVQYTSPETNRMEVLIPSGDSTYQLITDRSDILEVKNMLKSFTLPPFEAEKE